MKTIGDMSVGELAAFVCLGLSQRGIVCTLTGGACVTIYSDNKYQSLDLDFIESNDFPRKVLKKAMEELGFSEKNRYFSHPDSKWFIEFPAGPLSIGSEKVQEIAELEYETGTLRILSPTDCVKDRLAGFYFWDDRQSLKQALLVASGNKISLSEIERWSAVENCLEKFKVFQKYYNDI